MIIVKLFLGLLIAWMLGYAILRFFDRERRVQSFELLAVSYLLGQAGITLLLFWLILLPIGNRLLIAALLVAGLFFWWKPANELRGFLVWNRQNLFQYFNKRNYLYAVLLAALLFGFFCKLSYSFVEACSKPEYAWDASGNWTMHGKNLFYTEKYHPEQSALALIRTESSYPKLLPLMHAWLFSWMGEANDQWSKIIFPIELLCLIAVFFYGLRPQRGGLGALGFSYFLISAPLLLYHSTIGYADLTKTIYFSAGMIYFYRWVESNAKNHFWLFALFMAVTTWVKLEGKTLFAIGLALLLIHLWRARKEPLKEKFWHAGKYLAAFVFIGLPWQLFVMFNRITDPQGSISPAFSGFLEFHQKTYSLLFLEGSWGLFWVMAAAATLFFFKKQLAGNNFYLAVTIVLFYGNLLFIYLFFKESVSGMVVTFNRVLLPLYPLAVYNLGCLLPSLTLNQEVKI